uniref:ADP/ATP translocase n=1 Tax=Setaria italica TaxID=4555 RepID=K3ZMG4_SETIT
AAAAARRYTPQQQQAQPQLQHHQSQLGTVPQLLAGGVAGAVSKTCTARLARLTILFQAALTLTASSSERSQYPLSSCIVYDEGFRAFWKGNLVTIAHRLPYSSISFYAYERYKNLLQMLPGLEKNGGFSADVGVRLLGGGLSGVTAASMTYPLDLVRTRLAAQTNIAYYRGISHALFAICRDEDFRGLYKGLGATLLVCFSFVKLHASKMIMIDDTNLVTFPLDLVRRRMQLEGAGGRARVYHTGLFGTFGHIVRTEGFRGLYRGILPDEYCKVVPGVGIVFMTYEMLKAILTGLESDD